jgi:urease accessory protein UreE
MTGGANEKQSYWKQKSFERVFLQNSNRNVSRYRKGCRHLAQGCKFPKPRLLRDDDAVALGTFSARIDLNA